MSSLPAGMKGAVLAPIPIPNNPKMKREQPIMTTRTITAVGWTYDGIQVHIPVTVTDDDLWSAARAAADAVLLAGLKTAPQTSEYPKFAAHKVGWVVRRTHNNIDGTATDTVDFYADKGLKDPLCKDYIDGDYKREQFEKYTGLKLADIATTEAASITRDKPQQAQLQKYLTPVKGNVWIVVRDIGEEEQEKKSADMRQRTGNTSASARRKYFSRFIGSPDTDAGADDHDDAPPNVDAQRKALGGGDKERIIGRDDENTKTPAHFMASDTNRAAVYKYAGTVFAHARRNLGVPLSGETRQLVANALSKIAPNLIEHPEDYKGDSDSVKSAILAYAANYSEMDVDKVKWGSESPDVLDQARVYAQKYATAALPEGEIPF